MNTQPTKFKGASFDLCGRCHLNLMFSYVVHGPFDRAAALFDLLCTNCSQRTESAFRVLTSKPMETV